MWAWRAADGCTLTLAHTQQAGASHRGGCCSALVLDGLQLRVHGHTRSLCALGIIMQLLAPAPWGPAAPRACSCDSELDSGPWETTCRDRHRLQILLVNELLSGPNWGWIHLKTKRVTVKRIWRQLGWGGETPRAAAGPEVGRHARSSGSRGAGRGEGEGSRRPEGRGGPSGEERFPRTSSSRG